jgi:hypothetical protein
MTTAPTRRSVLAASGLLAGLGVGIGAAKVAEADPSPTPDATDAGPLAPPSVLVSRRVRSSWPGVKLGERPPMGTARLPYGDLESPDGASAGQFEASQLAGARGPMHLHRIDLTGGSLVGLGPAGLEGSFTVVGSTGRYAGAAGAYAVRQTGDGGLEFTFDEIKVV